MQYFRFLRDPAKLPKEAPFGPACPPSQVSASAYSPRLMSGAGTVTACFVDKGSLEVLVRLGFTPTRTDRTDFHFLGHELCLGSRDQGSSAIVGGLIEKGQSGLQKNALKFDYGAFQEVPAILTPGKKP
jgi:hypothetical protein